MYNIYFLDICLPKSSQFFSVVETGEKSQGRILHIIIGPLVLMSLNYFQIHTDAFPDE